MPLLWAEIRGARGSVQGLYSPLLSLPNEVSPEQQAQAVSWEIVRSRLRRWLVSGQVSLIEGGYDVARGYSNGGLDTIPRCDLLDILSAFSVLLKRDRIATLILVRDVGRRCERKKCGPGHCHRIPLSEMPELEAMDWRERERRTDEAVGLYLSIYST